MRHSIWLSLHGMHGSVGFILEKLFAAERLAKNVIWMKSLVSVKSLKAVIGSKPGGLLATPRAPE
jgi:hypothetical protein